MNDRCQTEKPNRETKAINLAEVLAQYLELRQSSAHTRKYSNDRIAKVKTGNRKLEWYFAPETGNWGQSPNLK